MSSDKNWQIIRSLGEGGQGRTFVVKSTDPADETLYVMKKLKNKNRIKRFAKEIDALRRLSHEHVVRIVSCTDDFESPFFVTEYCAQGDLSKCSLTDLSIRARLVLFRQICSAMAAAHKAGFIHRDLKPANILVRSENDLAVADFGLCLDFNDADDRLTATAEAVGPKDYIAPELEGGRIDDPKPSCDSYSLGKLLYYFLAGRTVPRERHREPTYSLLSSWTDPDMYHVYELLDHSIVERPERRFANASDFLTALDGVIEKIDRKAHVLDLNVRQSCLYCVEGIYQLQLLHEPAAYETGRPAQKSGHRFWGTNDLDAKPWMALVCDTCGNVQLFRRDLSADPDRWKNLK